MATGTANPFYIQPSTLDISPILTGIGQLTKEARADTKRQENAGLLMEAYKSGDPSAVAKMLSSNPELGATLSTMLNFKSTATEKGYSDTIRQVAAETDPAKRADILSRRIYAVDDAGGDSTQSQMALAQLSEDPDGFDKALELEFARTQPTQMWEAFKAQRSAGGDPEFLKEERKNASQDVRSFNRQAKEMRSSYGKLNELADQARGGNRGARNAMVVSLARLISPGIVTETEAAALGGGQNTMQAVISGLSGKGINTDALLRQIDPYGDSFDADGLLQVGESVVASSRQPLIDMYEGSRGRARRSGMKSGPYKTNFGANANYDFLIEFNQLGGKQAPLINDKGWQLQEDADGNRAYVSPGGEIEEVN